MEGLCRMKAAGLVEVWVGKNVAVILCLCCEPLLELSGCHELVLK